MRCPKGIELEKVHDNAQRVCLEALNAARTGVTREQMGMDAMDKAVLVQLAYDDLIAHIKECRICRAT